jgi:CDP-glucose 4,6-dehydratase
MTSGPGALDGAFWAGRRVFLTGHTGFIGGWTAAVLCRLGARVHGYALEPPTEPSFFRLAGLRARVAGTTADIRDRAALARAIADAAPDLVIHLAAQPLVGIGLARPVETFETNVLGTVNLLECARGGPRAVIVMTSDKVYRDGHAENHENCRLGADDPYGASKVCCELVAEAYARSFLAPAGMSVATVRAGNVVGGGDWAVDRLLPDAVRAFSSGSPLTLRRPDAQRPWQHVLDAVYGMLLVGQAMQPTTDATSWNVGPPRGRTMSVRELACHAAAAWGEGATVMADGSPSYRETAILTLSSQQIRQQLGYAEPWDLREIIGRTIAWYRKALAGSDAWQLAQADIDAYFADRLVALRS